MEPLAIYGAIVATISIGWQIRTRIIEKKTRLQVEARAIPPHEPSMLEVYCINHSEHPVRIVSLSFAYEDGSNEVVLNAAVAFSEDEHPMIIPSRAATNGVWTFMEFKALDLDIASSLVAIVRTADDKKFRSKPFVPADLFKKNGD